MALTRKAKNRIEMYSMLRLDKKEEENYYIAGGEVEERASSISITPKKFGKFKMNTDKIKLDYKDKMEIKELLKTKSQGTIASLYNVNRSTISKLSTEFGFEKYNGLKKLNHEDIREIKSLLKKGDTQVSIANKFAISRSVISNIKRGKIYQDV